jgi:hypothetical protein
MIGFCQNENVIGSSKKKVIVCNDEETALGCEYYKCKNSEESVQDDFEMIINSPSQCGEEYPKVAVLLWLLSDSQDETITCDISPEPEPEPTSCPPQLTCWQKIVTWITQ